MQTHNKVKHIIQRATLLAMVTLLTFASPFQALQHASADVWSWSQLDAMAGNTSNTQNTASQFVTDNATPLSPPTGLEALPPDPIPVTQGSTYVGSISFAETSMTPEFFEGRDLPFDRMIYSEPPSDNANPCWIVLPEGELATDYYGMGVRFTVQSVVTIADFVDVVTPATVEIIGYSLYGEILAITETELTLSLITGPADLLKTGSATIPLTEATQRYGDSEFQPGYTVEAICDSTTGEALWVMRANG